MFYVRVRIEPGQNMALKQGQHQGISPVGALLKSPASNRKFQLRRVRNGKLCGIPWADIIMNEWSVDVLFFERLPEFVHLSFVFETEHDFAAVWIIHLGESVLNQRAVFF